MGWFRHRRRRTVPAAVLELLPAYGQACLEARREHRAVADPRFDWDRFLAPVHLELLGDAREQVVEELYDAAVAAPDHEAAVFGAYAVLSELDPELPHARFRALADEALERLRTLGFTSAHLTGHEARYWAATRGHVQATFDGIDAAPSPDLPGSSRPQALPR